jgi:hypothetical protein
MKFLDFLKKSGKSIGCENDKGTFMPYTRKLTEAGGKALLILSPALALQHIGLCSTIDNGAARNWAPATAWDTGEVIPVPLFNFSTWEASHRNGLLKDYTVGVLDALRNNTGDDRISIISQHIKDYVPGNQDVPLPASPTNAIPVRVIRREDLAARTDGQIVHSPRVIRRVVVKDHNGLLVRR